MPVIPPPGTPGGDQSFSRSNRHRMVPPPCLTVFAAPPYIAPIPARYFGMAG